MFGILLYEIGIFCTFPPEIIGELYPRRQVIISVTFVGLSVSIVHICAIKHILDKSDSLNFPFKNVIFL